MSIAVKASPVSIGKLKWLENSLNRMLKMMYYQQLLMPWNM